MDQTVGLPEMVEERAVLDLAKRDADQVRQVQNGRDLLLFGVHGGDPVEARVGDGAGPDVGLPLAGLVRPRLDVRPGEEVEERRLAGLRVAEQRDIHTIS